MLWVTRADRVNGGLRGKVVAGKAKKATTDKGY